MFHLCLQCPIYFIAEHYLSTHRDTGELFSEKYEKVAVIFAAMPDFLASFTDDTDLQAALRALKALNEIIRGLDMVSATADL